jgi:hypothetical protein
LIKKRFYIFIRYPESASTSVVMVRHGEPLKLFFVPMIRAFELLYSLKSYTKISKSPDNKTTNFISPNIHHSIQTLCIQSYEMSYIFKTNFRIVWYFKIQFSSILTSFNPFADFKSPWRSHTRVKITLMRVEITLCVWI